MAVTDGLDSKASTDRKEDEDLLIGVTLGASGRHMLSIFLVSAASESKGDAAIMKDNGNKAKDLKGQLASGKMQILDAVGCRFSSCTAKGKTTLIASRFPMTRQIKK
jgi:hypothetical protein